MSHAIWRVAVLVVPLALIAGFLFRPTPVVGVDGDSLAASVGVPIGEVGYQPCTEDGEAWICTLPGDLAEEGSTSYSLEVDDLGCWKIEGAIGSRTVAEPERAEGCVTIVDHVEAIE